MIGVIKRALAWFANFTGRMVIRNTAAADCQPSKTGTPLSADSAATIPTFRNHGKTRNQTQNEGIWQLVFNISASYYFILK